MNPNLEVDITPRLVLELKMRKIFLKLSLNIHEQTRTIENKQIFTSQAKMDLLITLNKNLTKIGKIFKKFYCNFTAEFPSATRTSACEFLKCFLRICIEQIDPIFQTPYKSYSCKFS